MAQTSTIVVVGAGLGGLAGAISLAASGHRVRIFEKNATVGGKLAQLDANGFRFDLGPSLLTLPEVFRELFAEAGADFDAEVPLRRLSTLCRYRFADGSSLDLPDGLEAQTEAIHAFNPAEVESWRRFACWVREVYDAASEPFMRRPFGNTAGMTGAAGQAMLRQLPRVLSPRSLDGIAGRFFADARLRQLVGRFATYNGSTPFRAPATFAIIAHVEHALGAFHPIGGIRRIAEAELALARRLGVDIVTGAHVSEVILRDRRAVGVRLASNDVVEADAVLVNADATTAWERLLPADADPWTRRRLVRAEPSTSALVMVLGLRRPAPHLEHHNVAFSPDSRAEFADLFKRRTAADAPTVYVCASSRTDPSQAPDGCEALFVMVNLPAMSGVEDRDALISHQRERIFERLERAGLGVDASDIVVESFVTPADFASRDGSRDGSLYGPASNSRLHAFWRQPNRSRRVPGLFFAGGGAHPGGGMPLVTLSGRIAADEIRRYLASR
ncbi:MAG: phytoene desaturase [Blastocatellia bacterium]|jgi:phytoene desaturase|nr:phytoene desaturase [Blastocatellia bacterium]MBK6425317.1 phytoene desaturase [Blastocatellia bacterium]